MSKKEKYEPIYIKLTIEYGKKFIKNNKYRLKSNIFMDYIYFYNKDLMKCSNVYDKNWGKRIVLRHCVYDNFYELNTLYGDWIENYGHDLSTAEETKPLTDNQQKIADLICDAINKGFQEMCLKDKNK